MELGDPQFGYNDRQLTPQHGGSIVGTYVSQSIPFPSTPTSPSPLGS